MADIDGFCRALAADIALTFPDAEISYGERSGKATDHPRLAVFWTGEEETGDVVVAQATVFIRYWPVTAKIRDDAPNGVRDPGDLIAAKDTLQALLKSKQTSYPTTGVWYSRLQRVRPDTDPEEWGIEGELLLVFENPAVRSA